MNRWRVLKPCRLEIFEKPLAATLASITALAITPEAAGGIEKICAVDPNHAGFELRRNVQGNIDALAPYAGGQAVNRIVGEFHSFPRSAKRHRGKHRAENLLLRHHRSRMNVAQQRRREICPSRRYGNGGWPAGRSFSDALIAQPLNALELHARDDRANVDRFVERRANPQRVHAVLNLADQLIRNALLHQQPRTGAANLPLVEPDAVNQSFHGAIQIGVFKNDERRLTAKFEGKLLVALRGGLANRASHFCRSRERNLIDFGMLHQRFASRSIAGDDVHDAGGEAGLLADLRQCERHQGRKFRGLQHYGIPGCERGGNLPGQHEQWKIPRDDLAYDAASGISREFLLEQLGPARMMIKMPRHKWDINVAAFTNRLAVVQCFEKCEPARMFLHLPGQS